MKIVRLGVNYCHCKLCHTEFFFDKEDILPPGEYEPCPKVACPICRHEMWLGLDNEYFTRVEIKRK